MFLRFNEEDIYPEDYENFESFWEALPKYEDGTLKEYKPEVDFIGINNFDLTYPNNKEDVEELYKFITTLDTYIFNYDYDIYAIICGLYLCFNYNLNWEDLGNIDDNALNYIADKFAFEGDNFDIELFIEDNFDVNESFYYYKD